MAKGKKHARVAYVWATTRISLGMIFLWAFFDKLFGLGFATCRGDGGAINYGCDSAWVQGGSPTEGFLNYGTKGPFQDTFQGLAGNGFIDVLFMVGLLGIGFALIFGIFMKLGVYSGVLLMMMMWASSAIWPEHHPFLDDHVIYSMVMLGLLMVNDDQVWGLGKMWKKQGLVKNYPILE